MLQVPFTFASLLFISVITAKLLDMRENHRVILFFVESSEGRGLTLRVKALKAFVHPIRNHIDDTGHSNSPGNVCILDKINIELDFFIHEGLLMLKALLAVDNNINFLKIKMVFDKR